jgi:hypothetical protein
VFKHLSRGVPPVPGSIPGLRIEKHFFFGFVAQEGFTHILFLRQAAASSVYTKTFTACCGRFLFVFLVWLIDRALLYMIRAYQRI